MDRLTKIKRYASNIIDAIPSEEARSNAYIHSYGVAQACSLLAGIRGLNMELAYTSGLLHDLYAYKLGSYTCHSQSGAEMVRVMLRSAKAYSDDEQTLILSAIFHHDDIGYVHGEYDEVLKDADIIQPFLNNTELKVISCRKPRLLYILEELHMHIPIREYLQAEAVPEHTAGRRLMLGNIAEELASKSIPGLTTDSDFMEIIKYYPEESAYDELKNRWCSAFVYHCCMQAGIELPLKPMPASCRLAGVRAWYEWGLHNGFCFYDKDGCNPERGDIVIYNNIIPLENKEKNSAWHDHIGIVLNCDGDRLTVAEGNVNNDNISGIKLRRRDSSIGCYVRIPDDYQYNGSGYDYKTGELITVMPYPQS